MNTFRIVWFMVLALAAGRAFADTHYVVKDNAGAATPFTNWTMAASNIQQAIDDAACVAGDTVLVTNGVYDTGGVAAARRVYIDTVGITVRSVNGPGVTVIDGQAQVKIGSSARRAASRQG